MTEYNQLRNATELLDLRPLVATESVSEISSQEKFQNEVLRPIIKYQNDLLIELFLSQKNVERIFQNRGSRKAFEEKVHEFIRQSALKNQMMGMVLGLLTQDEWKEYQKFSKDLGKRILQIIHQRLCDNL